MDGENGASAVSDVSAQGGPGKYRVKGGKVPWGHKAPGEIEEAAIIQDLSWFKRMFRIIIPIQKSSIISGYMLPFMTCLRELSLFLLLCTQGFILSTTLDYFDEMGLYAFSSAINLILIVAILIFNTLVNKITGASLDEGIGGK